MSRIFSRLVLFLFTFSMFSRNPLFALCIKSVALPPVAKGMPLSDCFILDEKMMTTKNKSRNLSANIKDYGKQARDPLSSIFLKSIFIDGSGSRACLHRSFLFADRLFTLSLLLKNVTYSSRTIQLQEWLKNNRIPSKLKGN